MMSRVNPAELSAADRKTADRNARPDRCSRPRFRGQNQTCGQLPQNARFEIRRGHSAARQPRQKAAGLATQLSLSSADRSTYRQAPPTRCASFTDYAPGGCC
ncbi:MAG: hypothetical protein WKG07_24250 [Hymenobacter sp.]